jgi:ribonuclease Z
VTKRRKQLIPNGFHMFDLAFIGSGGSSPSRSRGAPCSILDLGGENYMFDAGEGSLRQIIGTPHSVLETSAIFITHLHADHILGLPSLVLQVGSAPGTLNIYGPVGLYEFLVSTLNLAHANLAREVIVNEMVVSEGDYANFKEKSIHKYHVPWSLKSLSNRQGAGSGVRPNKSINIHRREIKTDSDTGAWTLVDQDAISVQARLIKHRIPCFGFVVKETDIAGKLDADKCDELGVPPDRRGVFKSGHDYIAKYEDEDGQERERLVRMEDVCGPPVPGRKVVILGDTCDASNMTNVAMDCDVLVHEATAGNEFHHTLVARGHSTPRMAAETALAFNAKRIIINHVGSQYLALASARGVAGLRIDTDLQREARAALGRPQHCFVGRDFVTVSVPQGGYSRGNDKFLIKFPYVDLATGATNLKGESKHVTELPPRPEKGPHGYVCLGDNNKHKGHNNMHSNSTNKGGSNGGSKRRNNNNNSNSNNR